MLEWFGRTVVPVRRGDLIQKATEACIAHPAPRVVLWWYVDGVPRGLAASFCHIREAGRHGVEWADAEIARAQDWRQGLYSEATLRDAETVLVAVSDDGTLVDIRGPESLLGRLAENSVGCLLWGAHEGEPVVVPVRNHSIEWVPSPSQMTAAPVRHPARTRRVRDSRTTGSRTVKVSTGDATVSQADGRPVSTLPAPVAATNTRRPGAPAGVVSRDRGQRARGDVDVGGAEVTGDVDTVRTYRFEVAGLPPRPGKTRSMWSKAGQIVRLIPLRSAAREALGKGRRLRQDVRVRVRLRLPTDSVVAGYADDFLRGVCHGLRRAEGPDRILARERWWSRDFAGIHPLESALIRAADDIVSAQIEVQVVDADRPCYEVEVSGAWGGSKGPGQVVPGAGGHLEAAAEGSVS